MRKIVCTLVLLLSVLSLSAVPAKRGNWKSITLADGSSVRVQLVGDENLHYWQTEEGEKYALDANGKFIKADIASMQAKAMARRARVAASRMRKAPSTGVQTSVPGGVTDPEAFIGNKKGLIILVEYGGDSTDDSDDSGYDWGNWGSSYSSNSSYKFSTNKYANGDPQAFFKRFANEVGFSDGYYTGSVHDYFMAQSNDQFNLTFDVVGPYTVSNNSAYYAGSDGATNGPQLVREACALADPDVNFADYDWNGDGTVEEVFVIYAGKGQADGGSKSTVWPHMWYLSEEAGGALELDGMKIDTYACSCELNGSNLVTGIGTMCHEFSHCMGFPDLYDTSYSGNFGMGSWDLMDAGSYNGDGFTPAGYNAYEKAICGWITPIELNAEDLSVENLKPTNRGGDAYIMYNAGHHDEFYVLENRQKNDWDSQLPGTGLMIMHVDYDKELFGNNIVNTTGYYNNHERWTIFHADNSATSYNMSTDLYPYGSKDSLTNTSTPKALLYNANTDGKKLMNHGVTKIKKNSDGTVSFNYVAEPYVAPSVVPDDPVVTDDPKVDGSYLFFESFDKCDGSGGNDMAWKGRIASSAVKADNEGWEFSKGYGANKCIRVGSSETDGVATTPEITLTGEGEQYLTFKAGAWKSNDDGLNLTLTCSNPDIQFSKTAITMEKGKWTNYTVALTGAGKFTVTFSTDKGRFFLDEVGVKVPEGQATGINTVNTVSKALEGRIYTLSGVYVGNNVNELSHGIYIRNGKKFVK